MPNIYAIGITPGRTILNFEPNLEKEVSFSILNPIDKDMSVIFMVKGELANIVTLSNIYSELSAEEKSKSFTYKVKMPSKLETPGVHSIEIIAMEAPKDIEETGAFVGGTMAVASELQIYVPYPNKYAEIELNIADLEDGAIFSVPFFNRGQLDIEEVKATINIYSDSGEKISTLESEKKSIPSKRREEFVMKLDSKIPSGEYEAIVSINYDNEITEIKKNFNIGEKSLDLLDIIVSDFDLGEIAKFDILVENKWSSDLENVYSNIIVYNEYSEVISDFKSPTLKIDKLSKGKLVAYWDTSGVREGLYNGKIILKYEGKEVEQNIKLDVSENSIEIIGITGRVIVDEDEEFDLVKFLVILIIFLIIVNIIWFVIVKKLIKKKRK